MKTKKTFKRIAAAVAAVMMMCAVPVSMTNVQKVSAEHTITINSLTSESSIEHQYKAYQIFSGDLSGDVLSNIEWGNGVNTTVDLGPDGSKKTLINAIKDITLLDSTKPFSACNTAADVAGILKVITTSDAETTKAFADVVAKYKTTTCVSSVTQKDNAQKITGYKIDVSGNSSKPDGYYLVEDSTSPANSAKTRYILNVSADVTIDPKTEYPTLDKQVKKGNDWADANTAAIGSNVYYKLTSKVPSNTAEYEKYYFIVEDTLSNGLTLNYDSKSGRSTENSFTVKVGNQTLNDITNITNDNSGYTDSTPYNANTSQTNSYYVVPDGQNFKLVFVNFKQYSADADIEITYSAKLNNNAVFGNTTSDSNINTAKLIYSNDPNCNYTGTPGNGGSDDPNTPQDETVPKPDEPNPSRPDDPNTTEDESGTPEPSGSTPEDKVYTYTTKLKVTKTQNDNSTPLNGAGFSLYKGTGASKSLIETINNANGNTFEFKGLEPGTYTLVESQVPATFNKADDIEFTITGEILTANGVKNNISWGPTADSGVLYVSNNKEFQTTVVNNKGATLPGTGGIGTTIFYISGGVLVLGAGVVLITKKRMSLKDEK